MKLGKSEFAVTTKVNAENPTVSFQSIMYTRISLLLGPASDLSGTKRRTRS